MPYENFAELVANVSPDVRDRMKNNPDLAKVIREAGFDVPETGPSKLASNQQVSRSGKGPAVRKQPEDDFQKDCIDLLHLKGWTVAHFRKARTQKGWVTPVQADGKGFPDLVAVRERPNRCGSTVLWREVKTDEGKLTPQQEFWRDVLMAARQNWGIWKPSIWEQIVREVE